MAIVWNHCQWPFICRPFLQNTEEWLYQSLAGTLLADGSETVTNLTYSLPAGVNLLSSTFGQSAQDEHGSYEKVIGCKLDITDQAATGSQLVSATVETNKNNTYTVKVYIKITA